MTIIKRIFTYFLVISIKKVMIDNIYNYNLKESAKFVKRNFF